ncbi:MAG: hypothetical protein J6U20_04100 [Fibrobacter sp.]|nr:hypothetical protein [Fibrobacter sp.]
MINLSKMIERDFRKFLDENGGKNATIKKNGSVIEICLENGERGEFDAFLQEYANIEAYFIRRNIDFDREPAYSFKDANTFSFQCEFAEA